MEYDVIVVGSGPAGISASLYALRANLKVLIISKGVGTLKKVNKIENYYGLEKAISGEELEERGIKQAIKLGAKFVKEEVVNFLYNSNFVVETINSKYECKKLVIATGATKSKPNIKGIKEFEGKGISYCAICDGFFFKNKKVVVLGSKQYAIHEAEELKNITNSIKILTNGEQIIENRNNSFEVNDKRIREFRGTKKIEEVEFEDNSIEKIDGVFVAIDTASSSDLAKKIGVILDEKNNIIVDKDMQTNIHGLFACGDCTGGVLQISKAVYEGTLAGLSIIKQIRDEMLK